MQASLKVHPESVYEQRLWYPLGITFATKQFKLDPGQVGRGPDGKTSFDLRMMFRALPMVRFPVSFEELLVARPGDISPDSEFGGMALYTCGAAVIKAPNGFSDQYMKYRFKQCQEENAFQAGRFLYGLFCSDNYTISKLLSKDASALIYVHHDRVIEVSWIAPRKQWYVRHFDCDTRRWPDGTRIICFL